MRNVRCWRVSGEGGSYAARADELAAANPRSISSESRYYLIQNRGKNFYGLGQYNLAHAAFSEGRALSEKAFGLHSEKTAVMISHLGTSAHLGDLSGALSYFQRATTIYTQLGASNTMNAASTAIRTGEVLSCFGQYQQAVELISTNFYSLDADSTRGPPDASIVFTLGSVHAKMGKQAEPAEMQASAMRVGMAMVMGNFSTFHLHIQIRL